MVVRMIEYGFSTALEEAIRAGLRAELERATLVAGDAVLYEQLVELIIRVSDYMMEKHEVLRKKVRSGEAKRAWPPYRP